ncbi:hypothetical protein L9F63_007625, partial [Diploptera punctata]
MSVQIILQTSPSPFGKYPWPEVSTGVNEHIICHHCHNIFLTPYIEVDLNYESAYNILLDNGAPFVLTRVLMLPSVITIIFIFLASILSYSCLRCVDIQVLAFLVDMAKHLNDLNIILQAWCHKCFNILLYDHDVFIPKRD